MKYDVTIFIEHKAREFDTAILLKYFFEKRGKKCKISSIKFNKEKQVLLCKSKYVVVPWNYDNKNAKLFNCINSFRRKAVVLNMHHEQLSNSGSDAFILPRGLAKNCYHLAWGEKFYKKLCNVGCQNETIFTLGNPKLDYYNPKLLSLSLSKEEFFYKYKIDKEKKVVLFVADSFHLLDEKKIADNLKKGVDIIEISKVGTKCRNDFLSFVKTYLSNNNDCCFIYRPHPSFAHLDQKDPLITELLRHENFLYISGDNIKDCIVNSDIVISFHSTCVFECLVAKKKYYLFRSSTLKDKYDYDFFKSYPFVISDYNSFVGALHDLSFDQSSFLQPLVGEITIDDGLVCEKIVNCLLESKPIRVGVPPVFSKIVLFFKCFGKDTLSLLFKNKMIKQHFLNKKDIRFYNLMFMGDDFFTKEEILFKANELKLALETKENVK